MARGAYVKTEEHIEKIRIALKGRKPWNTGKKRPPFSEQHRKKISDTAKAKGFGKWMTGRKGNLGSFKKGQLSKEAHPNWQGGLTPLNKAIRNSAEMKNWRSVVFQRDNFTCVMCQKYGGELNADHIKPFALYPELRFTIDNGRTLCVPCHKSTDTFGSRSKPWGRTLV